MLQDLAEAKNHDQANKSNHFLGAATRIQLNTDLLQAANFMRRELRRYDLRPTLRYVLDWFLLETFEAGQRSRFVPGPACSVSALVQLDEKDTRRAIDELQRHGLLSRVTSEEGIEYTLDPDSDNWSCLTPLISFEDMASLRTRILGNPDQTEFWPERFCESSISTTKARLGFESAVRRTQGEIPPNGNSAASAREGKLPPEVGREESHIGAAQEVIHTPKGGNHPSLKDSKLQDSKLKALRGKIPPDEKEFIERCQTILGWAPMENDGGKWRMRYRNLKTRDKAVRVMDETKNAKDENRINTTPAQYSEQQWKEFD